ncbi:MAG: hypothetical protein AB1646_07040 [Thermodesulfobacteriota bacterium]
MKTARRRDVAEVRILYSEGCANTPRTVELVNNVAQDLDVPVHLEMVMVGTEEQARELRFLGSPTVRINGIDIEPEARADEEFGLA